MSISAAPSLFSLKIAEKSSPSESIRPQSTPSPLLWSSLFPSRSPSRSPSLSVSQTPFHLLSQSQFPSLLQSPTKLPSQSFSQSSPQLPSQSASHSPSQLQSQSLWLSTSRTLSQSLSQSAFHWTFQSAAQTSSPSKSIKLRPNPSSPLWSSSLTLFLLSQSPSLSMSQSAFSQSPQSQSRFPSLRSPLHLLSSALSPSQSLLPSSSSSALQSTRIQKLVCNFLLFVFVLFFHF